jgi:hypothetical protein
MSQKRAKTEPRPNQSRRRAAFLRDRLTPRVRDLFLDLMAGREVGTFVESQCLKVAELQAAAEGLRARLETADQNPETDAKTIVALVNAMTRTESTARRAAADLGKAAPDKPHVPFWEKPIEQTDERNAA